LTRRGKVDLLFKLLAEGNFIFSDEMNLKENNNKQGKE